MFDDKKQPDDMFAESEPNVAAPSAPPSALLTPPPIVRDEEMERMEMSKNAPLEVRSSKFGVLKVLLVVIVVLGLVAGAAYAAYTIMVAQPADDGIVNSVSDDGVTTEERGKGKEESETEDVGATPASPEKETIFDSDGDGLNNAEELDAGTLSNNPDTDSDGLGDREEVKVYGTDPRDSDTDGDTFLDGQEVAGGYNPNGDGKLFNVPSNP